MIVTCPNCSKRYMLDDALLPKKGRQVRCVACSHVWRQVRETSSPISPPPLVGVPDATLKAVSSETQNSWVGLIVFFALIASFFTFLSFGRNLVVKTWPQTERIYELFGMPANTPGAGLAINNAASQVQQDGPVEMIRVGGNLVNISDQVRSIPPLQIKAIGEISHPKCLEPLSDKECVLDHWKHHLSENSLLPGEEVHFETEPRPKVEGTQHIAVDF